MICLRARSRERGTRALLATLAVWLLAAVVPHRAAAQAVEDGVLIPKHTVVIGDVFSYDTWDEYWEGTLRRTNGNIGTVTTKTNAWVGNYGLTDRLNVLAAVPHVWTRPSAGVLHPMQGFQDVMLAAKFRLFERRNAKVGLVRGIVAAASGLPMTRYTPDFFPLSIGTQSKRVAGRFTLHVQPASGWFAAGSTGYTWRTGVTLDRPYYYTDNQLFFTDRVDMPNVIDYVASGGYARSGLMAAASFSQQRTLGGGDIRRQDMPFVSNRMNFSKVGAHLMAPVPKVRSIGVLFSYAYTLDGRNVGKATTYTTGLVYSFSVGRGSVK
jgi:hypothetical protein